MVLAIYTAGELLETGTPDLVGGLIAVSIVRELGPVLTAIVVTAQAGSAIAAELGTMKVTEQIDALRALATDPVEYLVVPRYLAAMVSLPLATVVADLCGVLGGLAVSLCIGVGPEMYFDSVLRYTKLGYFLSGLVKAVVFGAIIALVGSYQGLRAGQGAAAVGRSTTRAVVLCILIVYVADYFLTLVFT
jgi:phospholipid/cholesterol/gamma-HCH transport system permease protein